MILNVPRRCKTFRGRGTKWFVHMFKRSLHFVSMAKPMDLSTPHGRLRWLRQKRGYESAKDFSTEFKLTEGTYRAHENGGRAIRADTARKYGQLLDANWGWILTGQGKAVDDDFGSGVVEKKRGETGWDFEGSPPAQEETEDPMERRYELALEWLREMPHEYQKRFINDLLSDPSPSENKVQARP